MSASRGGFGRVLLRVAPDDEPRWIRPALLITAAAAGVLYGWQATGNLEIYYAAGVRSMTTSWHNFFFAAFDPRGTVSLDKLPGAFWVQALSARLFGFSAGSIVAPQVIEAVITVLVLFRAVKRLAGPVAALTAAVVLAVSPATVALNRGNISDTLMVLLIVLAANATVTAVLTGRARHAILTGIWVGLAFQAKMLEAWLVLPALVAVYLLSGTGSVRRRIAHLAGMIAAALVVSLSWMSLVSVLSTSGRPYVDGSPNDSLFHQVFVYNGFGRLDQVSPNQLVNQALGTHIILSGPGSWNRFLSGNYGRDAGWLIPAAVVVLVLGLVARRRAPREDRLRAGLLLWGVWLAVFLVALSADSSINSYYAAVFSPAVAALIGIGAEIARSLMAERSRDQRPAAFAVAGAALLTAGYAAWLLPAHGTGLPEWLLPVSIAAGILAAALVVLPGLASNTAIQSMPGSVGLAAAAVAILLVPATASVSITVEHLGPFDTPFESAGTKQSVRAFVGITRATATQLPKLEAAQLGAPDLMATQTSVLAAPFIYLSGREVLPIGGYTGSNPAPTLNTLRSMIRAGQFHLVLLSSRATGSRLVWITNSCQVLPHTAISQIVAYFCATNDANRTTSSAPSSGTESKPGSLSQQQLAIAAHRVKRILIKYPAFTVPAATLETLKANPTDTVALAKARQVLGPNYLSELAALTRVPDPVLQYLQKWGPIVRTAVADGRVANPAP